jgi:hypothetical protein
VEDIHENSSDPGVHVHTWGTRASYLGGKRGRGGGVEGEEMVRTVGVERWTYKLIKQLGRRR